jgi:hypothetical protein
MEKLRTVIWDFAGEPIPESIQSDVILFLDALDQQTDVYGSLIGLLSRREVNAMVERTRQFLSVGKFPMPSDTRRPYPWPPV